MYQDNTAAIQLEKHGKKSSSRRTRHFDIRFFNVGNKLRNNNIEVVYCPTEKMVADFFTKPLQASQFRRLRQIVMGKDPISTLELNGSDDAPPKERVGCGPQQEDLARANQCKIGEDHHQDKTRRTYADIVRGMWMTHQKHWCFTDGALWISQLTIAAFPYFIQQLQIRQNALNWENNLVKRNNFWPYSLKLLAQL